MYSPLIKGIFVGDVFIFSLSFWAWVIITRLNFKLVISCLTGSLTVDSGCHGLCR